MTYWDSSKLKIWEPLYVVALVFCCFSQTIYESWDLKFHSKVFHLHKQKTTSMVNLVFLSSFLNDGGLTKDSKLCCELLDGSLRLCFWERWSRWCHFKRPWRGPSFHPTSLPSLRRQWRQRPFHPLEGVCQPGFSVWCRWLAVEATAAVFSRSIKNVHGFSLDGLHFLSQPIRTTIHNITRINKAPVTVRFLNHSFFLFSFFFQSRKAPVCMFFLLRWFFYFIFLATRHSTTHTCKYVFSRYLQNENFGSTSIL